VVDEAFANLTNGPTIATGDDVRMALQFLGTLTRNDAVRTIMAASAEVMGSDTREGG
jgi:hypothetical protein